MLPFYLSDFREFHLRDPSTLGILNEVQQRKIISPSFLERFGYHSSGVDSRGVQYYARRVVTCRLQRAVSFPRD